MRLGIYGGSFSPVHNAHVRAAKEFLEKFELDKLLVIPAGESPSKSADRCATPSQRLEMCRIAFSGMPKIEISDMEIRRGGKSYTALTVRELENECDELFLLCGADKIPTLDAWYCFEEILSKCTLVYVRRESGEYINAEIDRKAELYRKKYGAKIKELCIPPVEMSSTEVRSALSRGEDVSDTMPSDVYKYVKENRLYKN